MLLFCSNIFLTKSAQFHLSWCHMKPTCFPHVCILSIQPITQVYGCGHMKMGNTKKHSVTQTQNKQFLCDITTKVWAKWRIVSLWNKLLSSSKGSLYIYMQSEELKSAQSSSDFIRRRKPMKKAPANAERFNAYMCKMLVSHNVPWLNQRNTLNTPLLSKTFSAATPCMWKCLVYTIHPHYKLWWVTSCEYLSMNSIRSTHIHHDKTNLTVYHSNPICWKLHIVVYSNMTISKYFRYSSTFWLSTWLYYITCSNFVKTCMLIM